MLLSPGEENPCHVAESLIAKLGNPMIPDIRFRLDNEFMGRSTSQYFINGYKSYPISSKISLD